MHERRMHASPGSHRTGVALVAQALHVCGSIVILPAALWKLGPSELGMMFVFMTIASALPLLDFGFQSTIARNAAYIHAGATRLVEQGLLGMAPAHGADPNGGAELLARLAGIAIRLYRWIAALGAVLALGLGTVYVSWLSESGGLVLSQTVAAWLLYAFGHLVTLRYAYAPALLNGRGDVTQVNVAAIASRSAQIVVSVSLLAADAGLMALACGSIVCGVVAAVLATRMLGKIPDPREGPVRLGARRSVELLRTLLHNASREGANGVAVFLILRSSVLVSSSVLGLAHSASYAISVTMLIALNTFASVACTVNLPKLNQLQIAGDRDALRILFSRALALALSIHAIGLAAILVFAPAMLQGIGHGTQPLAPPLLLALGLVYAAELNHSLAGAYLTTTNVVPFTRASVVSGVCVLLFGLVLAPAWGAAGLIAAQGLVQLAYNNWRWPTLAARSLGCSWWRLVVEGARGNARRAAIAV